MRLIEIAVVVLLLPLFLKIFASGFSQFSKIHEKNTELELRFSKDIFVASSFEKFCADFIESQNSFDEEKIFELEKLNTAFGIEKMKISVSGYADGKTLLKCCWKNTCKENYLFAIVPEKAVAF